MKSHECENSQSPFLLRLCNLLVCDIALGWLPGPAHLPALPTCLLCTSLLQHWARDLCRQCSFESVSH